MKLEFDAPLPNNGAGRPRGPEYTILQEFIDSGKSIARINLNGEKKPVTVYNTLYYSIKRHGLPVSLMKRGNDIYLARKEALPDAVRP